MSNRGMGIPERTQSKFDDALMQYKERVEHLTHTLSNLEDRLRPVMNDYPRTTPDNVEREADKKPSGDSALLLELYSLNSILSSQSDRVQDLLGRLDI